MRGDNMKFDIPKGKFSSGDYLLASLITAKCFETTKGGSND